MPCVVYRVRHLSAKLNHVFSTAVPVVFMFCHWTAHSCMRACDADGEDTEEIVQHLRAIEGVEAAALFKDYEGAVRVSLRSSGRINVQAAAAALNGGGHFMASGLTFEGPLAAAIEGVHAALRAQGL